ncbi:hypothetical protein DFH09DRAFT_1084573 [Mycena vulgaris]|nr:hypothetical protein DFH09DRAFT_1084573 [Mycena vulgaris]
MKEAEHIRADYQEFRGNSEVLPMECFPDGGRKSAHSRYCRLRSWISYDGLGQEGRSEKEGSRREDEEREKRQGREHEKRMTERAERSGEGGTTEDQRRERRRRWAREEGRDGTGEKTSACWDPQAHPKRRRSRARFRRRAPLAGRLLVIGRTSISQDIGAKEEGRKESTGLSKPIGIAGRSGSDSATGHGGVEEGVARFGGWEAHWRRLETKGRGAETLPLGACPALAAKMVVRW